MIFQGYKFLKTLRHHIRPKKSYSEAMNYWRRRTGVLDRGTKRMVKKIFPMKKKLSKKNILKPSYKKMERNRWKIYFNKYLFITRLFGIRYIVYFLKNQQFVKTIKQNYNKGVKNDFKILILSFLGMLDNCTSLHSGHLQAFWIVLRKAHIQVAIELLKIFIISAAVPTK